MFTQSLLFVALSLFSAGSSVVYSLSNGERADHANFDIESLANQIHDSVHQGNVPRFSVSSAGRSRTFFYLRRAASVQTSTSNEFVYLNLYKDSSCSDLSLQSVIGTNQCVQIGGTTNGARSMKFAYVSSSNHSEIDEVFYSDTACSTYLDNNTIASFGNINPNSCVNGNSSSVSSKYYVSDTFSVPDKDGYLSSVYVSQSACEDSSSPLESAWAGLDFGIYDDQDFTLANCSLTPLQVNVDDVWTDNTTTTTSFNATVYTTTNKTSGSSSTKFCFAGSEVVLLSSGELMPISEVRVGQLILAADQLGNTKFSEVVAVPHDKNSETAMFTLIATISGGSIKATPDHLVMVQPTCSVGGTYELRPAGDITTGMCLVSIAAGLDEVTSVSTVTGAGVYTVVTKEEMVVVNGFIASPFSVNHAVANAYYNIVRLISSVIPGLMELTVMKRANLAFGDMATSLTV